ncbi:ClpXP adapter SpxH family protein [Chitinophaga rhizophila]|uniref:DsbA family protein n=1 Tax=Chitinophaga rhizophila TaxID=2866212 RepID=A0ABS7G5G7_9BACT|nr:ClpXP adapter SpxH family protein [Chitinophaga rhizophila]MBW8682894.1 DsbA family protein [Chitinophaga rhizophila]
MKTMNPLLCDPENGICEMPGSNSEATFATTVIENKPLKIIYFTDPICSSCWGIEPQLRKLKMEYGQYIEIEYRMGGLLPDWSYNSGGISKPSDVAHHWDEVSHHYQMPIDGDVWLEDPLSSSYPPSIAFKAAQIQDEQLAVRFLRKIREMVFLEKKNITRWEHLRHAAAATGLDTNRLKTDYETIAVTRFQEDLAISRQYGVRGFPTMFVTDNKGNRDMVYGSKPYAVFETSIRKLLPDAVKKQIDSGWQALFLQFRTLTTREFAELSGNSMQQSEIILEQLCQQQHLEKFSSKNGPLWICKS